MCWTEGMAKAPVFRIIKTLEHSVRHGTEQNGSQPGEA